MADLSALNLLLKAPSKQIVEKVVNLAFISRTAPSESFVRSVASVLEVDDDNQASALLEALVECIQVPLATGSIEDLAELFKTEGAEVNPKLKSLVGQIVSNRLEDWKESAALSRVSLPHLVDFDWTLHFQKASSEIARMEAPSVIISLDVEGSASTPAGALEMPDTRTVDFEVSREALETVIDGLGKIRDQLSKMG